MPSPALVSIVIPVFNDEAWIANALDSCLGQSLEQVEVICVDDASSDRSVAIIEDYQQRDSRIRLIRQPANLSAFQARRAGILAATADHVLFLDGDDELNPDAAVLALAKAQQTDADLVGFGVEVLLEDGRSVAGFQSRLAPVLESQEGVDVLRRLFPVGEPAHGQLWRYLFRTSLLREVYDSLPADLVLKRANDLPITFLAVARAGSYAAVPERLYRYFFRRGGSGQVVADLSQFAFYLGAVDSVNAIGPAVTALAEANAEPELVGASYASARLTVIGTVLDYLVKGVKDDLQSDALALLHTRVPEREVVLAAARNSQAALGVLARHGKRVEAGERPVGGVLLTTNLLRTGGVSGVLLSQARFLLAAGHQVTIAATRAGSDLSLLPQGATFVEVTGRDQADRLLQWERICQEHGVDVIIEHQILYSRQWHGFALMARTAGIPTIGWIHNFALRPTYDSNRGLSYITGNLGALATLVVLSPLDVAFWKLRGAAQTVYLPNPPSPMLLESSAASPVKPAPDGRLELIWWGRLEQHTKRVGDLVLVADQLRALGVDFQLTIVGPDWSDLTAEDLLADVNKRGLSESVRVVGPLRGQSLLDTIDAAHLFVGTSIIEGYPLTLAEAQSRGLPVVMYEMPWLALAQDNPGLVTVPQGEAAALARAIAEIAQDPKRYAELSAASTEVAKRASSGDFAALYEQLVTGTLPAGFSPEPTLEDARRILDLAVFFSEQSRGTVAALAPRSKPKPAPAKRAPVAPRQLSLVARGKRKVKAVGRRVLRAVPALRPVARRLRRALGV